MTRQQLIEQIRKKKSFLCIGLDTDITRIPPHLAAMGDPVFEFNKAIIDATHPFCIAYKPNLAFYESLGPKGLESLEKTLAYIPDNIFTIADAKRGDIGNTANLYAKTFFEYFGVDAVTVAPYMGADSITPFLNHPGKWAIVLALTSNEGASDFQFQSLKNGTPLYAQVIQTTAALGSPENLMFVAGATRGELLAEVRKNAPDNFLLVPGVGAQGGSLEAVCRHALTRECGLIVNASRSILYASPDTGFAGAAGLEAQRLQMEMQSILRQQSIV